MLEDFAVEERLDAMVTKRLKQLMFLKEIKSLRSISSPALLTYKDPTKLPDHPHLNGE
jgi:hypothetical protein